MRVTVNYMGTLFLVCKKCEILEDASTSLLGKVFAHGYSPVRLWVYWISEVIPPTHPPTHFASLAVRWRSRIVEPNVRESMSSVAVANTFPALTM